MKGGISRMYEEVTNHFNVISADSGKKSILNIDRTVTVV